MQEARGDFEASIDAYRKVLALEPGHLEAQLHFIERLFLCRRFQLLDLFSQNRFVFVQPAWIVDRQFIFRNLRDGLTQYARRMGIIAIGKQGLAVCKRQYDIIRRQ